VRKTAKYLNGSQAGAPRRVVILGLPPVDALDLVGPAEVFAYANHSHHGQGQSPYVLEVVSAGPDVHMASEAVIGLTAHRTLEQESRSQLPIDTLIVATGFAQVEQLDKKAIAWIRDRAPTVRRICSICIGAFALAEAGLLDGRKATTHWGMTQLLANRYPNVHVDPNPIWVKDGNVYTSAGISSGIDLALALVSEDLGNEVALEIARHLVLFLRRPGGQAQFSVALQSQQAQGSSLNELCIWIGEHLQKDLSVEVLAERLSTSVRTLIRLFQRELQTTPAKFVEDIRLEAACRSLELGGRSIDEIAQHCGYNSADVLRKAFTRRIGISPKDYVQRFSPERVDRVCS
jgi:transcriptional regulator GlxA family with amidase domain